MAKEMVTPDIVAARTTELFAASCLVPKQAQAMGLAAWAACQAVVELGGSADENVVEDYASQVFDQDDPALFVLPTQVMEAVDGEHGVLLSDQSWALRQRHLQMFASDIHQVLTSKGEL